MVIVLCDCVMQDCGFSTLFHSYFSHVLSQRMGAAIFCFGGLNLAVLYLVVARFLAIDCFHKIIPHTTGRLANIILQSNCLVKTVGYEICQYLI